MDESILGFRFADYNEVKNIVQQSDLASYSFIGIQVFASTFIIIKLIYAFVKDVYGGNKLNNVLECFGLIVFISLAPYALSGIEDAFSFLDDKISSFHSYSLPPAIKDALIASQLIEDSTWATLTSIGSVLLMALLTFLGFIIYAVDSAIYAMFILERLIMIEFYRFVFPLFIAFIGIDGLRQKYWHWVTGFIGLMILPIPYLAIYHIMLSLQNLLFSLNRSKPSDPSLLFDLLVCIIVLLTTMGIKYKLLSSVTSKVTKLL